MILGKLKQKVQFQRKVVSVDSDGATIEGWTNSPEHKIWARIDYLSGSEMLVADKIDSKIIATVIIRYRNDIDHSMRIIHKNQYFNIESVLPDNKSGNRSLKIKVSQGLNEG